MGSEPKRWGRHHPSTKQPSRTGADYWRHRAAEARESAGTARDPVIREMLLDLARTLESMAEEKSRREK